MHLRTLTLRGFKSFASSTSFEFEPGITCVVGPNGSGKSNVVDALAWVMGEQGAKSLRGAAMADVIFAGTSHRPALGRAEVSLTIDNSDGALPIDYAEVTITRTLFRSGGSEYAINGAPCRLLDIQDLLSDSGIGREMHIMVGQGQLDAVLRATPEERRGFIEEAAGVLKHRKRKEKALRKLDAMQANLQRVEDITAEVRRQLGPLGRQADVARRAAVIQADVRDAQARLLADDLAQASAQLAVGFAQQSTSERDLERLTAELVRVRDQLSATEADHARCAATLEELTDQKNAALSLRERLRAVQTVASDRLRMMTRPLPHSSGPDPEELQEQAEQAQERELDHQENIVHATDQLAVATLARERGEHELQRLDHLVTRHQQSQTQRMERRSVVGAQIAAQQARVDAATAECDRVSGTLNGMHHRVREAIREVQEAETRCEAAATAVPVAERDHERALTRWEAARTQVRECEQEERAFAEQCASSQTRIDTLTMALYQPNGPGAALDAKLPGVLGTLAELLTIAPGGDDAVAAALGVWADAIAVQDADHAVGLVEHLRMAGAGRVSTVIAHGDREPLEASPPTGRWVSDLVQAVPPWDGVVQSLLAGMVHVANLADARKLVREYPRLVAVTHHGDVVGAYVMQGGSSGALSSVHWHSARELAREELAVARRDLADARQRRATAAVQLQQVQLAVDAAAQRMRDLTSEHLTIRAELERAIAGRDAFQRELDQVQLGVMHSQQALTEAHERLEALTQEYAQATEVPDPTEDLDALVHERAQILHGLAQARHEETEAHLALRTAQERLRAVRGQAQALLEAADRARQEQQKAQEAAQRRAVHCAQAERIVTASSQALTQAERTVAQIDAVRHRALEERDHAQQQMVAGRDQEQQLSATIRDVQDAAHREEMARIHGQLLWEQLAERGRTELGLEPEDIIETYGPHHFVELGDGRTVPFDRAEQEKRLKTAQRDVARLGSVNPLALEEFAAVEERHRFLASQLADIKKSRTDLLHIVAEIDDRVRTVLTEAFADTAWHFERVFSRLFPGGEGRLVLTDPESILTTGVEVEARPAGKRVKRLSLLSGGERALTAVAFLVAIFKARPSPFYVMDEVEAALDDVNLGRLLEVFRELQQDSQLIVVTHQKRTMEIADALYGVTMQGDGVTTVISQRVDHESAVSVSI